MSKKPGKRLVPKQIYIKAKLAKGGLYSGALSLFAGAFVFLCLSLLCFSFDFMVVSNISNPDSIPKAIPLIIGAFFCATCFAAIWCGISVFKKAETIEDVTPITRHNTGELPLEESLVRAAALPPGDQEAQLLRAASQGWETPPQDLLRATTGVGKEAS